MLPSPSKASMHVHLPSHPPRLWGQNSGASALQPRCGLSGALQLGYPTRLLLTMTIGAAVAAAGRRASADKDDGSRQRCRRRPCLDPARLTPPTRLLPAMTVGVTVAAVGRRASGDGSRQRGRRRLAPGPLVVTARFLHPRHNKPFSGYYFHLAVPRPLLSSLRLGRKGGADDDDGSD